MRVYGSLLYRPFVTGSFRSTKKILKQVQDDFGINNQPEASCYFFDIKEPFPVLNANVQAEKLSYSLYFDVFICLTQPVRKFDILTIKSIILTLF